MNNNITEKDVLRISGISVPDSDRPIAPVYSERSTYEGAPIWTLTESWYGHKKGESLTSEEIEKLGYRVPEGRNPPTPYKEYGVTFRKILPDEKSWGGGVGAYSWTAIRHPDGTYENVRDLDREFERHKRINEENKRRSELRSILSHRVATAEEMNEVLALGTDLMRDQFEGFQIQHSTRAEQDAEFLHLLNLQAVIRKLDSPNA